MPNRKVFDHINGVTRVYDPSGKYLSDEQGNTTNTIGGFDPSSGKDMKAYASTTNVTDVKQLIKDVLLNVVQTGAYAAQPEVAALSPLKNMLLKLGIGTAAGTGVDQLINAGTPKTTAESATDALFNSFFNALPEVANIGIEHGPLTRKTRVERSNSGTARSQSMTSGSSGPEMQPGPPIYVPGPPIYVPGIGPQGQKLFGKMQPGPDIPSSSGVGNTVISREAGVGGWLAHLLDSLKTLQSYKYSGRLGPAAGNLSRPEVGLAGLLANLGFDIGPNRPTKEQ